MFAEHGFDGTRVAAIAAAAGVSNGALYAHFASKADLLVDALRTHGRGRLADLFAAEPDLPVTVLLLLIGRRLPRRRGTRAYLAVEALAHFCLLLALGSALVPPDLHPVGEQEWGALLTRVVADLAPAGLTPQPAAAHPAPPAQAGTAR